MNYPKKIKSIAIKFLTEISYYTGRYTVAPDYLSLTITYKCNFHCPACASWKQNSAEIDDEAWLKIAEDLKSFLPKNTFTEISGGEPLLKKDLALKLIPSLKKHFVGMTLNSNGLLVDENSIRELEKAGLDRLKISLYGLNEKTHNLLRGSTVAYKQVINAIKLLQKSNIKLEIGILITSKNIREIPGLIENLSKFKNISVILQAMDEPLYSEESHDNTKNYFVSDLWPNKKQVLELFEKIEKFPKLIKNSPQHLINIKTYYLNPKNALNVRCFVGSRNLIVFPNGDLALCYKKSPTGNLTKNSIKEILTKKSSKMRREIRHCQKFCRILGCIYSRGFWEVLRKR